MAALTDGAVVRAGRGFLCYSSRAAAGGPPPPPSCLQVRPGV